MIFVVSSVWVVFLMVLIILGVTAIVMFEIFHILYSNLHNIDEVCQLRDRSQTQLKSYRSFGYAREPKTHDPPGLISEVNGDRHVYGACESCDRLQSSYCDSICEPESIICSEIICQHLTPSDNQLSPLPTFPSMTEEL